MADVIGFYGANNLNGEFSNFYYSPFTVEGKEFFWAEQFIMYQKAMLFEDTTHAALIMLVSAPLNAKRIGRQVTPFDPVVWEEECERLVVSGLFAKFTQNPRLREKLLSTGEVILCECSPRDRIWGIGMGVTNRDYKNPACWRGTNRQGNLLMKVRAMIREQEM